MDKIFVPKHGVRIRDLKTGAVISKEGVNVGASVPAYYTRKVELGEGKLVDRKIAEKAPPAAKKEAEHEESHEHSSKKAAHKGAKQ